MMHYRPVNLVRGLVIALGLMIASPAASSHGAPTARGDDANRASKNGHVVGTVGDAKVVVEYGRPKARGRKLWGNLVSYGKVWRTGADEATTITFSKAVKVEGKAIAAGTYALFTIPGEKQWTVILNKQAKQWGAYKYDASQDAARATVSPKIVKDTAEALTFSMDKNVLTLRWGNLALPIKMTKA